VRSRFWQMDMTTLRLANVKLLYINSESIRAELGSSIGLTETQCMMHCALRYLVAACRSLSWVTRWLIPCLATLKPDHRWQGCIDII